MSKFAIRLLTPATYAAALVIVPAVTPAKVTTNSSKPKKHWDPDFGDPSPSVGGGSVPGLRVRQRRPAQASTGASGVGRRLLPLMTIPTENTRALTAAGP
jgi:hypothetical protein